MLFSLYQICGLLIALIKCHQHQHHQALVQAIAFDEISSLQVWLTVDSLAKPTRDKTGGLISRHIELNWINAPLDPDGQDYIALYLDSDPMDHPLAAPVSIHKPTSVSGRASTDYYLPYIDFYNETITHHQQHQQQQQQQHQYQPQREYNQLEPTIDDQLEGQHRDSLGSAHDHTTTRRRWHQYNSYGTPPASMETLPGSQEVPDGGEYESTRNARGDKNIAKSKQPPQLISQECLGYCVAYHDGRNQVLARSCLRTQPTWMQESRLGSRSLPSLMIPGAHNSGTYPKHLDRTVLQAINKYQINQEESVFNQLVYGIRYLDLRVGYSKVKGRPKEELWIYHDIFRTENSVNEIFKQVRKFLEMTQQELLVLDFHRFTVGFQNENIKTQLERHAKLLDLLFQTLGDWIVPSYLGQHAPINEYIERGKRLVVCYADRTQLLGSQLTSEEQQQQQRYALMLSGGPRGSAAAAASRGQLHNQVRDIDAEKQDNELNATSFQQQGQQEPTQHDSADRRVGTRIYNRLKSLKVISHSFSKRSVTASQTDVIAASGRQYKQASGNVYKGKQRVDHQQHLRQDSGPMSMKVLGAWHTPHVADSMNSKLSLLFNSVRHIWPNTDTEKGLKQFIDDSTCRKYFGELSSLMAEMTPGVFGAIWDQYDGIRKMSHQTNRMVTDQIRTKFLHCINMVASDYFLGNDLIRLSIYANEMRLHHQRNIDLSSVGGGAGRCKSFRRISHLLDESKISSSRSTDQQTKSQTLYNTQQTNPPPPKAHQDKESSDLFSFFGKIFNF